MKKARLLAAGAALALLTGCAPGQMYLAVTPHEEQYVAQENADALVVSDYEGLQSALQLLITRMDETGLIRVYGYESGDVSEDVAKAVYQAAKQTALGTYSVDYITYDCSQVVSYYEIALHITYTKTAQQMARLVTTRGSNAVRSRIAGALEQYETKLLLYVYSFEDFDLDAYVQQYYEEHPATVQALPEARWQRYPETGSECILELQFSYPVPAQTLLRYQSEVSAVAAAAVDFVQYRETEREKLQLLYFYLSERFQYEEGTTITPVYSVLCEGVADSGGMARAMQVLCSALGLECRTVHGTLDGEDWDWNIVRVDGQYYHADAMRALRSGASELTLNLDSAMSGYSWDTALYPVCALRPDTGLELRGEDGGIQENVLPGS